MKTHNYSTLIAAIALLSACTSTEKTSEGAAAVAVSNGRTANPIVQDADEEAAEPERNPALSIADFEQPLSWSSSNGDVLSLSSQHRAFGRTSLAVRADSRVTWTSRSLQRIQGMAPEQTRVELHVRVPEAGAVGSRLSLSLEVPSIGVAQTLVETIDLSRFKPGEFQSAWFRIPAKLATVLHGASYSDLKLALTLDPGVRGTYHFDGLAVAGLNQRPCETTADTFEESVSRPVRGTIIASTLRRKGSEKFPNKKPLSSRLIAER